MSMRLLFYILLLLYFIFGVIPAFPHDGAYWGFGGTILHFILFLLLGYKAFGPPISE